MTLLAAPIDDPVEINLAELSNFEYVVEDCVQIHPQTNPAKKKRT